MVDKQSCKIISIVVTICVALAALDLAWTYFGPCKADVMMMLDDSGSVSDSDFGKVKDFVRKLANDESINEQLDDGNVQIGMATFSQCSRWMGQGGEECNANEHSLKFVHNRYSMNEILDNYQRMESITDMIKALEFVNKHMMDYARSNSDKILLFMTDGVSQGEDELRQNLATIKKQAQKLKDEGVRIYVIAVGEMVDQMEIETISSSECESTEKKGKVCKDAEKFIIKVDDFDGLDGVISELAGQVCNHQYWMAAIPIVVAILFVVIKLLLDRREAKKLVDDTNNLQNFTPGMASNAGRV